MRPERTLVLLAAILALACESAPVGPGPDDSGVVIPPPMRCVDGRLELVRGEIGALACYPAEGSGPIEAVEVPAPPAGLALEYVPAVIEGRAIGNLRVSVADDAPLGESFVELVARGPGGEARSGIYVTVIEPEGQGIVVGLGAREVSLETGAAAMIPVRVVSYGGYAGDVVLWGVGPGWEARQLGASFAAASGTVGPGAPLETTLTLTGRFREGGTGETLQVHAASARHHDAAELLYELQAPADGVTDLWATLAPRRIALRAGETARASVEVTSSGALGPDLALFVTEPAGWSAQILEEPAGRALAITASDATPEGGAEVGVRATLGELGWSGSVRVVRPPISGAWGYVSAGPLAAESIETFWDGAEDRRALAPSGSYASDGVEWTAGGGAAGVEVQRGGGAFASLAVGARSVLETAIVMPPDDHPFVVAATSNALLAWHFLDFGAFTNEFEALPTIDANDGREVRPLAVAYRDGRLAVAIGQETPASTSRGPSSILAYVWDGAGSTSWRGTYFAPGATMRAPLVTGEPQLALALDATARPVVAWIDASDGAVHVEEVQTGAARAPIPPSAGRIALGVDLVLRRADDRPIVLVHEGPDLFGREHPALGAGDRVRVLEEGASGWTELADVTLPDVESRVASAQLGLGAADVPRVVFTDATGTYAADRR